MKGLEGRTAAITGGARGIGLAIARRLSGQGARCALWDRPGRELERAAAALPGPALAVAGDLARPEGPGEALERTAGELGPVDILVNNAGVAGDSLPLWEIPYPEWRRVLGINLDAVFACCRAVVPGMISRGYGRIVNIASIAGKEGNPRASHYSASKAGVIALTKSLGKELAQKGVLVNAVAPAVIRTPILEQCSPEHVEYMVSRIPMGRTGEAEEVAALAAWLCSGECSFSTGAVYDISGGRATY